MIPPRYQYAFLVIISYSVFVSGWVLCSLVDELYLFFPQPYFLLAKEWKISLNHVFH